MNSKPAFTLAEMLVVMLISGIIVLSLFEGMNLVNRYGSFLTGRITSENGLLYGYQNLSLLFRLCDSLREEDAGLCFYRQDVRLAVVEQAGSLLICRQGEQADTLFRRMSGKRCLRREPDRVLVDSLWLSIFYGTEKLTFSFGISDDKRKP